MNCFKFEKQPPYLETFEDKEFVYIGLLSQVGGEIKIKCDFSKSMPNGALAGTQRGADAKGKAAAD